MLEQLKRAYISRVTRNGCDDPRLYNQEMLRKLDEVALAKFKNLHAIIGATKANHTSSDVDMAKSGLTNEQYEELERIQKKAKKERTPDELKAVEEAKEKKKNADAAVSILRGISIRLPLLMYGAKLDNEGEDITLENFASLIDDQSWEEFMPRGVTKELFAEFTPYYDPDMFRAVGRNYRDLVRAADKFAPMQRTKEIARIFSYFRNPDKETVLTPWRVVNMHISDCIGGRVFLEDDWQTECLQPRFVDHGEVTSKVFKDPNTRILEINSKTGLYPRFMAYGVFAEKLQVYRDSHMLATDVPIDVQNQIWDEVLRNHIFVICKTEMAVRITQRTLRGFRLAKVNAHHFEDLINIITNQPELFISKVSNGINYWKNNSLENDMKFNAIVGNPPYQKAEGAEVSTTNSALASAIYPQFITIARSLSPKYLSMITPSRWMSKMGRGVKEEWVDELISCNHFVSIHDYIDSADVFPGVDIKGGVNYFLYQEGYTGECVHYLHQNGNVRSIKGYLDAAGAGIVIRDPKALSIIKKVCAVEGDYYKEDNFSQMVSAPDHFGKHTEGILTSNWKGYSMNRDSEYSIKYYLNKRLEPRGYAWVKLSDIPRNHQTIPLHKIFIPKASSGGTDTLIVGGAFYGEPGSICSQTYMVIAYEQSKHKYSKEECENIISYLNTKFFRYLVSVKKKTQDVVCGVFQFVPLQDWTKTWTDRELYTKYNLSKEEIDYIESMIKAADPAFLFDPDNLINPDFANFDLSEYGVKIGDHIVYTPTGQELIVSEGNSVEFEGELYSLAQFTAKYMPRNKRSVSGVCQGPKYFSYKGVSLYQMKESFLGGNK